MGIFIGLTTVILVLNSAFLILLILIQLPKKEAGMGTAFGGGAMQDMFGAQHGNVLTTATKYSAGLFLVLSLGLSMLNAKYQDPASNAISSALEVPGQATQKADTNAPVLPVPPIVAPTNATPAAGTNASAASATNAAATTVTPTPKATTPTAPKN